jgi:tRNA(fMet)-specific endonuclease VapC
MIVADSDVLIDYLHGKNPARDLITVELRTGQLATTAINAFELLSGARSPADQQKVQALLAALRILPVEALASAEAATIRRELEVQGNGIGMADYLVAGVCVCQNAVLLTRNREHFGRVPRLALGTLTAKN